MMMHSSACDCEASLCETLRGFSAQHPDSVIYQTSLMSALLSGVYEGETTIADLLAHGDFGLGTFNELDGEMIAFSSQVYQLRADGSARAAKPEQKTPFAVMTWFQPQYRKAFDGPVSRQQTHDVIDQQIPSDNLFCALRIDGNFRHAHTRTVPRQTPPYRAMTDVLDDQPVFRFNQARRACWSGSAPRQAYAGDKRGGLSRALYHRRPSGRGPPARLSAGERRAHLRRNPQADD